MYCNDFNNHSTAFISGNKQVTQVLFCVRKKIRVDCFYFTFPWYLFHLFFVFFETFVRIKSESSPNQLRKKGTFCEQNSSLTATWFNSNPYLFSSKCHIKFWYNKKQVSCFYPASKVQGDIHYPFLIHSFG